MKHILVTGASRGIGFELVQELVVKRGCSVVAISRNEEKLAILADRCNQQNGSGQLKTVALDLCSDGVEAHLESALGSDIPHLDGIVNNAGQLQHQPFDQMPEEAARHLFDVNVFAPARLVRALLPRLKEADRAHVVNIGSMGGYQGSAKFPGLAWYSSSKAALAILSECLAEEWKEEGISCNCLALGAVQTEMLAEAFPGYQAPLSAPEMAGYIADFVLTGHHFHNGKVLPVSVSTP